MQPEKISLSYISTTRNKLPYLKVTFHDLFLKKKDGEEIIVADGNSTDGTPDYLKTLLSDGRITRYISEPDKGESHALNKLLLMARGELITIVTDDDAFDYDAIQRCKEFMLAHPEIDVMSTNGGFKGQGTQPVRAFNDTGKFIAWQNSKTPFMSCGLGLVIRKSSIPLLGLWNTNFKRADAEYLLRITATPIAMAWYTGWKYVNVSNPQSVSVVYRKKIDLETDNLLRFYLNKRPLTFFGKLLNSLWNKSKSIVRGMKSHVAVARDSSKTPHERWQAWYSDAKNWLAEQNKKSPGEFIYNK